LTGRADRLESMGARQPHGSGDSNDHILGVSGTHVDPWYHPL